MAAADPVPTGKEALEETTGVESSSDYIAEEAVSLRVPCGFGEKGELNQETLDLVKQKLEDDGVCCLDAALDQEALEAFRDEFLRAWERLDDRITEAGVDRQRVFKFAELCSRKFGRFDVSQAACGDPAVFNRAREAAVRVLERAWQAVLGPDAVVHMAGVIMNKAGSDDQAWHRDSSHLFPQELPPHAIVIFIPLVPMTEVNGPTHFKPGSHKLAAKLIGTDVGMESVTCWPGVGSVTMWDYRLLHRGKRNRTEEHRPVMYLAVTKPWYKDSGNAFPTCSIFDEGPGQGAVPMPSKAPGVGMQGKLQRLAMKGLLKTAADGDGEGKCKQQ